MYQLKTSQRVSADLNTVYHFFAKPENLATITPDWLNFQILTPAPIPMREGAVIDYQIGLGPFPTRWRTMITTFSPPHRFVDEQLDGPYSFWHHTHRFEETAEGTLLSDEIRYLLPMGFLGRLAHETVIKSQLRKIFSHRHRFIAEKFKGSLDDCEGPEFSRI